MLDFLLGHALGGTRGQNVYKYLQMFKFTFKFTLTFTSAFLLEVITLVPFTLGKKKGKRKVQGVPQSQTAALPRPQEEEETDKSKQAQTEQTYEKH